MAISDHEESMKYRRLTGGIWREWQEIAVIKSGYWTPELGTLSGEKSPSYSATIASGEYKKVGNLVYISFYIRGKITALNGVNNYAIIRGLPYTPISKGFGAQAIAKGQIYNAVKTNNSHNFIIHDGGIRIQYNDGAAVDSWKISGSNDFQVSGAGWYLAD